MSMMVDHGPLSRHFRIEADRIVGLTGKVELGQGILTAFAQIVAEELDVPIEQVAMVSGDTSLSPDQGVTAGSLSIEVAGEACRQAASALRELVLARAADRLSTPMTTLCISNGVVLTRGADSGLTVLGLVGGIDLGSSVNEHAAPKPVGEHSVSGASLHRLDLRARITGASFIHDLTFADMLHGRVVRPPRADSRLVTDQQTPNPTNTDDIVVIDGSFVGVAARTAFAAEKLAAATARTLRWSEPGIDLSAPQQILDDPSEDIETAIAQDATGANPARRIEASYSRPFIAHASIGVSCAIARWEDGKLEVWSHSQGVFNLRQSLARALRVEEAAIIVRHVPGAGCYGHNGADDVALDAALIARAAKGRHVRVVWSRADELRWSPVGSAMRSTVKIDLDAENRVVAFALDVASGPHGARPGSNGAVNLLAAAHLADPIPFPKLRDFPTALGGGADRNGVPLYDFGALNVRKHIHPGMLVRTSSLRALGAPINVVAIECTIDRIAHEIGEDPLAFRLRHLGDPRARHCLERVAALSGWPGETQPGEGFGLAFARYKNKAAYCALVAKVSVDEDVRLTEVWSVVDAGRVINPDGAANQVEGGIVQSASWTLKEAVPFDENGNAAFEWEAYPILSFAEAPRIHVELVSRLDDPPLGVGETSQGPTAAAILNAASAALGTRLTTMPLTRDALIAALS
jgi:nicotinate dehydrogenase subunit B